MSLELTQPAGPSPKMFASGWIFGARCTVDDAVVEKTFGVTTVNPVDYTGVG
ncbi:MAG: hypothetical protein GY713_07150, partial [Actinomycetia bacterium]|nr:hypothetical protein [Actinomycetes bacterium]